jgi:hypothetical protein
MKPTEIREGFTRVSTVLSPFSGIDKIDPMVLQIAANRGTVVHQAIDKLIKGADCFDLQFEIEFEVAQYSVGKEHHAKELQLVDNMITSYLIWAQDKELHPAPGRMYDDDFMITGEIDAFYFNKDKQIVLVDFKTPVSESKTWKLQGSAYWYMFQYRDMDADIVEFVKLDRKGNDPKSIVYEPDFILFQSVLRTYNYFYKDYKPDVDLDYI